MRQEVVRWLGIVAVVLAIGCGSEATPPASSSDEATTPSDPIARVVHEFLDAVRRGDTSAASERLTPLALKRTSEYDLEIAPPGSDTARFEIGTVEKIDEDKAVVESTWTDIDVDGKPSEERITWALKLANDTWRVSGMAADIGPDQPPVVMDFENPGQMATPQSAAERAPADEDSMPRQAAQQPQDPFRSVPR